MPTIFFYINWIDWYNSTITLLKIGGIELFWFSSSGLQIIEWDVIFESTFNSVLKASKMLDECDLKLFQNML